MKKPPKLTENQKKIILGDEPTREWMSHATYLILKDFIEKQQTKAHEEFVIASYMLGEHEWNKSNVHPTYINDRKTSKIAREDLYKYYRMRRAYYDDMLKQLWYAYSLAAHPNVVEDIAKNKSI